MVMLQQLVRANECMNIFVKCCCKKKKINREKKRGRREVADPLVLMQLRVISSRS
jgi:hypothetical protein